jgi:predicted DNA-binding ribbon-helix-helix protein
MADYRVFMGGAALMRLKKIAEERELSVEALLETAAEEAALDYFRHRKDDPGRQSS